MIQEDKRARISAVRWIGIDDAEVDYRPGYPYLSVSGEWVNFGASSAELKETLVNGEMVQQELKVTITDTGEEKEEELRKICSAVGLIRVDYTNGVKKVVGTAACPVSLSMERSGTPDVFVISTKRSSPEPAKFFKSF